MINWISVRIEGSAAETYGQHLFLNDMGKYRYRGLIRGGKLAKLKEHQALQLVQEEVKESLGGKDGLIARAEEVVEELKQCKYHKKNTRWLAEVRLGLDIIEDAM
jgi:hypothetical protein